MLRYIIKYMPRKSVKAKKTDKVESLQNWYEKVSHSIEKKRAKLFFTQHYLGGVWRYIVGNKQQTVLHEIDELYKELKNIILSIDSVLVSKPCTPEDIEQLEILRIRVQRAYSRHLLNPIHERIVKLKLDHWGNKWKYTDVTPVIQLIDKLIEKLDKIRKNHRPGVFEKLHMDATDLREELLDAKKQFYKDASVENYGFPQDLMKEDLDQELLTLSSQLEDMYSYRVARSQACASPGHKSDRFCDDK